MREDRTKFFLATTFIHLYGKIYLSMIHFIGNFKKHRFSRRDLNGEYIGESFDADDSHDPHLRQIAACYESRPLKLIMLNLRYLKAHSSLIRWIRDFVAPR